MSKRILVISSSPRKGGNSDLLCDEFLRGALEAGHRAEKFRVAEHRIAYCTGCGACSRKKDGCAQRDDMAAVLQQMVEADVLVLATPVYFYTVAAQMKTLIDRCCARYQELRDKEFYFILAAADSSRPALKRTLEEFRGFTGCLDGAREKGVVYGVGAWNLGDIQGSPALDEAYRMGLGA